MGPDTPVVQIEAFSRSREGEVWSVISQVWAEFGIHDDPSIETDLSDIAHAYRGGASGSWIAVSDDRVVGTVSLKDLGGGLVAMKRFYVLKDFRGPVTGTAQRLFDQIVRQARQHEATAICLGTIEVTLAAQRFYERNGFQRVARSELPAEKFADQIDSLFYRLSLI